MKHHAVIFDVDSTLTNNKGREEFANDFVGGEQDEGGKRNEAWHDMFQDGRLYHLDKPIYAARRVYARLQTDLNRAVAGIDVRFIMVSGRRFSTANICLFYDWLEFHGFDVPDRVIFRPKGQDTDSWKHSVMQGLAVEYDLIAGYGNERDMSVYERVGIEAILVDEDGHGWKMPDRWAEVVDL